MTVKPYLVTISLLIVLSILLTGCKKASDIASELGGKPTPTPTPSVDPKDVYVSKLTNIIDVAASKSASIKERDIIDGQVAILADVNGGELRGEGGIYRNFGVYNVYAKIKLDQPKNNNFYQAWVSNPKTGEYFSIGKMEPDSIGQYNVSYNTDNIHPDFDRIIVSLESTDDNQPEKHIVEGTIGNILGPAVTN